MTLDLVTGRREPVVADLPSGTAWELGGFGYGLEPLTLPHPDAPDAPGGGDEPAGAGHGPVGAAEACHLIRLIGDFGVSEAEVEPWTAADELYWFRWITGHQVSFVVWRLMAGLLADVRRRRVMPAAALGPLRHYVRGYGAMLLYTGSCPRALYHDLIRPSMRLRHRGFSGSWAPDYGPIRGLMRSRRSPFGRTAQDAELMEAIRLQQRVHDGVAAKLVPDGRSLLRRASTPEQDTRLLGLLYDNYFMTLRAPVTRHEVVGQLLRRLVAIAQDLAANTLYPVAVDGEHGQVAELRAAEVIACEHNLTDILYQVARSATGAPAVSPGARASAAAGGAPDPCVL